MIFRLLLVSLLFLGCSGCATPEEGSPPPDVVAFQALMTSLSLYNISMEGIAELQRAGYVTTEQRAEINQAANVYRSAHLAATQSLRAYRAAESAEALGPLRPPEDLMAYTKQMALAMAEFTRLVSPLLTKEVVSEPNAHTEAD